MKNKVNIFLCDDNNSFINGIEQKIKDILTSDQRPYEITTFSNGAELINRFADKIPDVVFLDIDMPQVTGFEVAEKLQALKEDIHIIFITSHEDKVFQSYEFHPFWFVRKSHLEDLNIVLPKLFIKIDSEFEKKQSLYNLIAENKTVAIDINKVKYISAYDHYVIIKNSDDTEIQTRCRISDAEKQLHPLFFIRVQNSVIINCRFISKVNSRTVILHSGEKISISRSKVDYVKNEFLKFMRSR